MTAIASVARQRTLSSQPTISRVKESMIAFSYTQPCSATHTEVMSRCQLAGPLDRENPGRRLSGARRT